MEFRTTITLAELGYDEANGGRVLEGFEKAHHEVGAVVSQNIETGTLAITFSLDAASAEEAWEIGARLFADGVDAFAARAANAEIIDIHVTAITAEERDPELQPA